VCVRESLCERDFASVCVCARKRDRVCVGRYIARQRCDSKLVVSSPTHTHTLSFFVNSEKTNELM